MDKEFFMNSSTPHQMQYDHPFSSTMPTWQTHDYFISTQPPNDHFESTFSSMVSSPTSNSALSTDNFMVRELIGKLGNICNTNDIPNYMNNGNCSTNNSCYTTPLSSPPKLGMSMPIMDHMVEDNFPSNGNVIGSSSDLPAMPSDPGFAERAARFSSLGSRSFNGRTTPNNQLVHRPCSKLQRVLSSPSLKVDVRPQVDDNNNNNNINNNCMNEKKQSGDYVNDQQAELSKSRENSSISGQNNQVKQNGSNRKRKAAVSKKNEEEMPNNSNKVVENRNDSNAKRSRAEESNDKEGDDDTKPEENKEGDDGKNQNKQLAEPPKDYIHVRARRGQATDSHSLAERVRREKIGERMKLLQDLVPGCNKVTGKALMLDEIINYVQSLQRQVEFLSMKLSNVNPRLEMNMCNPFSKEAIQPNCTLTHPMYSTMIPNQYGQQPHHQNPLENSLTTAGSTNPCSMDPLNTILNLNHHNLHLPPIDGFANYLSQLPSLCEGDLQSIVEMGFGQKENGFQTQTLHGSNPAQMKIEF